MTPLQISIPTMRRRARQAVAKRDTARDMLAKGRCVSIVLRAVNEELPDVLQDLQRGFNIFAPREQKLGNIEAYRDRIEDFEGRVAQDSASQATWLAIKGRLHHLSLSLIHI